MQVSISKPIHNKYVLFCLDNEVYSKYAGVYSNCKRWGVRGIFAFLGGTGLFGVAKELTQGVVVQYGKKKLAAAVVVGATYVAAPAVAVFTNVTKIVNSCKFVYTCAGAVIECAEDASLVPFIPLDLLFFGQIIPVGTNGRYTTWSNVTDIIATLPGLND